MNPKSCQVVICDDEEVILKNMSHSIETEFQSRGFRIDKILLTNPVKLQEHLKNQPTDVLFLDIDMPYINGMEIAAWIQEERIPVLLVFVTNQDTLVYQTFRYQPFGFIRKSVFEEEIGEVIERIALKLQYSEDYVVWQHAGESIKLKLEDIFYLEADSNYVNVKTKEKEYRFRDTLTSLENKLEAKGFFRIHKGFLINGERVHVLKSDHIEMEDGAILPIGRSYSESVRKKLMLLMRKYR